MTLPGADFIDGAYAACMEAIDLSVETDVEHAVRLYDCGKHLIVVVAPIDLLAARSRCGECGKRARAKGPIRRVYDSYLAEHREHMAAVARGAPWN